jgi:hypothetical protein
VCILRSAAGLEESDKAGYTERNWAHARNPRRAPHIENHHIRPGHVDSRRLSPGNERTQGNQARQTQSSRCCQRLDGRRFHIVPEPLVVDGVGNAKAVVGAIDSYDTCPARWHVRAGLPNTMPEATQLYGKRR